MSYFLNINTESNHFPVPISGSFLNQLWPDVSRTEGAQKNKMVENDVEMTLGREARHRKETVIPIWRPPGADR